MHDMIFKSESKVGSFFTLCIAKLISDPKKELTRNFLRAETNFYFKVKGGVSVLMVLITGYCTISDYNKQNSVLMF